MPTRRVTSPGEIGNLGGLGGVSRAMKVAFLLCALAVTAVAAPRYTRATKLDTKLAPQVLAAEQAWNVAAAEVDLRKQTDLWEAAAFAFGEIDSAPVDAKVKREAAYAAIVAWKNAVNVDPRVRTSPPTKDNYDGKPAPQPLPAREQKIVAAFDRYVAYMDPADPEIPGVLFLKANLYRRFDQLELAIPIFRTLIDRYPRSDVAEYAANMLLDSYNRLGRYDQLLALADELAKNAAFLRDRDDLAQTVAKLQRTGKRKHAEDLERAANESKNWDTYTAAGKAYLDIYNANPESRENDEVLYNAGVAFEQGRSISPALQMYSLLEKNYPNSRLTARAIARTGKLYGDIAMYDRAAEKLEQYAKRYAGEKDAYAAMSDAIFYRKAIGDRAKTIEDTNYFIKVFGAKKPLEAANASWSLTAIYEADPAETIAHLETYLRMFGAKGGADRIVIAHARIGALLWQQACPQKLVANLCVKVNDRAPRSCGAGNMRVLTATKRDEKTSLRAHTAFAAAVKEFEKRSGAFDDPAARYYYAQAKLAQADVQLETYLSVTFPRDLTFDPKTKAARESSLRRFSEWIEEKQKLGSTASRKFEEVLMAKDAASSITAAARLGMISQAFASDLTTSTIPRGVSAEARDAYCDAMTNVAAPLEARAVEGFAVCLAKSTELGWFSEASTYCEHRLFELKPDDYPRTSELRVKPLLAAPVIVVEPPVR
jgi:tetratricopeptide (TPR) repeat protein